MSLLLFKIKRLLSLKLIYLFQAIRIIKYRFLSYLTINGTGKIIRYQPVHMVGGGTLEIDGTVRIGVYPSPFFLSSYAYIEARYPGSSISIGDDTWINNGFSAIAEYSSISIGRRCLLGSNIEIINSDFHGMEVRNRRRSDPSRCKPVLIEDDVFLGSNVTVLKGVTIGRGSVIANGSIVTQNIPPFVIAGGNPIRVIRYLESEP
jgi:maltose O-acetyltransferase